MVKDHPPDDVRALGIHPHADRSHGYRTAAAATYVTGIALMIALATLPWLVVSDGFKNWWPLLVVFFAVVWQAGLVCLVGLLLKQQTPSPADGG
jgi:heme/copper-type cytochrome/quinol oxidase subunit 4